MPSNTPTIYVVGALIALGGVLFGALGQIVSSTLQRRHEARMKLFEVRRETYAAMFASIRSAPDVNEEIEEAGRRMEVVGEAAHRGEASSEAVDFARARLQKALEQGEEHSRRRGELAAMVMLLVDVRANEKLIAVLQEQAEAPTSPVSVEAAAALVVEFRKELHPSRRRLLGRDGRLLGRIRRQRQS